MSGRAKYICLGCVEGEATTEMDADPPLCPACGDGMRLLRVVPAQEQTTEDVPDAIRALASEALHGSRFPRSRVLALEIDRVAREVYPKPDCNCAAMRAHVAEIAEHMMEFADGKTRPSESPVVFTTGSLAWKPAGTDNAA